MDSVFKSECAGHFYVSTNKLKPKRKTAGSAGYDFICPQTIVVPAHKFVQFDTGVRVTMRKGYMLKLFIRSSLGKKGLSLTNAVGIIDSDYKDTMQAFIMNNSDSDYTIYQGDRYMQGIFERHYITDDDDATEARTGGIGSTGK